MSSYVNLRQGIADALSKAGNTISKVAVTAGSHAQAQINALAGSKLLKDYQLLELCCTCGPGDIWKIYKGVSKRPGAYKDVSIWILDKRGLQESNRQTSKPASFDALFEQQRKGCSHMTRLKHPGIVKVIEQLEETQTQMILVTESVIGSLRNVLTQFADVGSSPSGAMHTPKSTNMALSQLEVKLGLVVSTDYAVPSAEAQHNYNYSDPFPPLWDELAKPILPYTSPELVGGWGGTAQASGAVTPATDIFSLACVAYELLCASGPAQLIPVRCNVHDYRTRVSSLSESQDLAKCPPALQGVLRSMLSIHAGSRPSAAAFSASSFFQEDVLLRALRFLETVLQREVGQKAAFLNDLSHFWTQFDDRLLKHKVIPPLLNELRTEPALQPAALPVLLPMMEKLGPEDFCTSFLPQLQPVFESAQGDTLALLVRHGPALSKLMSNEALATVLIPMYSRALENMAAPKLQEEVMRHILALSETLDYSLFKAAIMPRVYAACLRTTSATVRALCLALMSSAAARLDREEGDRMLEVVGQVTSVDRTSGTITCVAQLGDALSKQFGAELTATRVLPLLCPLLVSPSLSGRQFKEVMGLIQGMLERIQQKVASENPGGQGQGLGASNILSPAKIGVATGIQQSGASTTASWDVPLETTQARGRAPAPVPATANTSLSSTAWTPALSASARGVTFPQGTSMSSQATASGAANMHSSAPPSSYAPNGFSAIPSNGGNMFGGLDLGKQQGSIGGMGMPQAGMSADYSSSKATWGTSSMSTAGLGGTVGTLPATATSAPYSANNLSGLATGGLNPSPAGAFPPPGGVQGSRTMGSQLRPGMSANSAWNQGSSAGAMSGPGGNAGMNNGMFGGQGLGNGPPGGPPPLTGVSDPFSSLSTMAMSAPIVPHKPQPQQVPQQQVSGMHQMGGGMQFSGATNFSLGPPPAPTSTVGQLPPRYDDSLI